MSDTIPNGTYSGRVVAAAFKKSGQKGTEYIEFRCEITEEGDYCGVRLECAQWFNSPENCERGLKALIVAGWDGQDPMTLDGIGSTDVELVVELEEPQPNPKKEGEFFPARSRVKFFNERGSSALGREMTLEEAEDFGGRLMLLLGSRQHLLKPKASGNDVAASKPMF